MANQLSVELVAVESKVWSGEAQMVVARTTEGEIGVLSGHEPLLGQLAEPGQVRIKLAGGEELAYDVSAGFLSVTAERVTVLAESATPASPAASAAGAGNAAPSAAGAGAASAAPGASSAATR